MREKKTKIGEPSQGINSHGGWPNTTFLNIQDSPTIVNRNRSMPKDESVWGFNQEISLRWQSFCKTYRRARGKENLLAEYLMTMHN